MQPPETRYAVRDGISIAYQVVGDGPFDLVFAPGFVSHLDLQWTDPAFARFLTRLASFSRLILFDKPGTGLSDPISSVPTLEERAADLRTVLDAAGSDEAAILAFSEAGPATLMLAATHPERVSRLVLVGTFAAAPQRLAPAEWAEADAELRAWVERATGEITEIVDHWGEGRGMSMFAPSLTGDLQRRFYATFERAAASPRMVRALIQHVLEVDVRDVLPLVRQPTLVLHRRGDRVVNVVAGRRLAEEIDGAQFVELEGEDHAFWFGDFDPILDQIERFLTGMNVATRPDRILATVLFTDIVSSTELAGRLGDSGWRDLLQRHDAMLRRTVEHHGGQVVKHIGDGALSRFDGPAAAVRCAQALGDDVAPLGIELRAGVHTGECEVIGDDLGGMAVHIGARVQALAPPGTVLVSRTVKDLVVGSEMLFADHGEHELKGVPGSWRIYALAGEQEAAAPPLEAPGVQMGPSDRVVVSLARRAPRAMRVGARLASRRLRTT